MSHSIIQAMSKISNLINYFTKIYKRNNMLRGNSLVQNPLNPINVDPKEIKYSLLESSQTTYNRREKNPIPHTIKMEKAGFRKQEYGTVLSGDWDLYKMRQKDEIIFRGLYNHLVENKPFVETEYGNIKNLQLELFDNNKYSSIHDYYDIKINELMKSMKKNGYMSIGELYNDPDPIDNLDEFDIVIGRSGELISNSRNHHRLSLAKILDIDRMPVIVIVRHADWQDKREKARQANNFDELSDDTKGYINHPDIKPLIDYEIP